jgi:hypothetical protein
VAGERSLFIARIDAEDSHHWSIPSVR